MCGTDSGRRCEYREVPEKPELREIKRKELDIPPDGFHIVSVGELVENKNHAVVIEAVAGYTTKIFITVSVAKALTGKH